MESPQTFLNLATHAATEAGHLLLERFRRPATGVETKTSSTDPVSDADRDAEALIKRVIGSERPNDRFLAEESGGSEGDPRVTWIVDPLDGTVNYLFGIPVWAVSIAVEKDGLLVAGVVHDPNTHETFSATFKGGARLNGRPIKVSDREDLTQALVGTGFAYDERTRDHQAEVVRRVLPRVRDVRRGGSAALDLAFTACGRLDVFYEAHMQAWDKAAGVLLIREAGGVVSTLEEPYGDAHGVVAGPGPLHDALRSIVTPE